MNLAVGRLALLLVGSLVCGAAVLTAGAASAEQQAIKGVVSGAMIQKVGFRAMIQKQAIMYNLPGYARNIPDRTVSIACRAIKSESTESSARYGLAPTSRHTITKSA
jgi:Acylphosphatase